MRLPKDGSEWADVGGDEKACAHLLSQRAGEPINAIANSKPAVMRVSHLRMAIPPSSALRRPSEEGTTDVDGEEGQQLFGVEHGA